MRKIYLAVLSVFLVSLFFTGCGGREASQEKDAKEAFLNAYFTTDFENRYHDYVESQDLNAYYATLSDFVTEECLNTLKANREPIKWDTYYAENGMDVSVQNMSFEVYDDNVYSFTASLEIASDDTKEVSERTGQITVLEEDGKEKVSHIYVNP